jgi:hypothetical protein
MNGLELYMCERNLHERRQLIRRVKKSLEVAQRLRHRVMRRRYETRRAQRTTGRADPVLTAPKFARLQAAAAHALHQLSMNLANQSHRDGQVDQPFQAVMHCPHIVDYFIASFMGQRSRLTVSRSMRGRARSKGASSDRP